MYLRYDKITIKDRFYRKIGGYLMIDNKIPAKYFVDLLRVNVDNEKLSDEEFRQIIRNTLPIVESKESE